MSIRALFFCTLSAGSGRRRDLIPRGKNGFCLLQVRQAPVISFFPEQGMK